MHIHNVFSITIDKSKNWQMTINYKLKNQNFFFDSLDITAHCRGSLQTAHIEDREKGIA